MAQEEKKQQQQSKNNTDLPPNLSNEIHEYFSIVSFEENQMIWFRWKDGNMILFQKCKIKNISRIKGTFDLFTLSDQLWKAQINQKDIKSWQICKSILSDDPKRLLKPIFCDGKYYY